MRNLAFLVSAALLLASATADSYQEAYADSRGPGSEPQSAKLNDRSPSATASGAISPGVVYGAPLVQPSPGTRKQCDITSKLLHNIKETEFLPAPVYGVPLRQQYGPPAQINTQYGAPLPVYGPPASLPQTAPSGPVYPDQGLPFNIDILGFLQSIPLPDIHSVLKIIFKITVLKAVIKVITLFALILFAPKLEDIFNMIGMVAGITGDGSSHDSDAVPSTMNDGAEEEDADETTTKRPASASRAAKERRLDMMARALHDSINKTAHDLACRGDACGFGPDSQNKPLSDNGIIARVLRSLSGSSDSKKKPVAKNLKKSLKAVAAS